MIKPLMYDCFKLDLRIIMIGFREHVTQNVSDSTDVLGESGRLFIFLFLFLFFLQHTSLYHYLEAFLHSTVFTERLLLRIPGTVLDVGVGGVDKLKKKSLLWCLTFYSEEKKN